MIWFHLRWREQLSLSLVSSLSHWGLGSGFVPSGIGVTQCLTSSTLPERFWYHILVPGGEHHCILLLHQSTCSSSFPDTSGGKEGTSAWQLSAPEGIKASKTTIPLLNCFWSMALLPAVVPGPSCREPASWSGWEHLPLPCRHPGAKLGLLQAARRDVQHSGKCSVPPGRMLPAIYPPQTLQKN